MGLLRLIAAPLRHIANSRLFQLVVIVAIILLLDHYSYDYAVLRSLADGLKRLVTATVQLCSQYFRVGILTDPVLQVALLIVYVYIVCLLVFYLMQITIRTLVDLVGASNFLWLRSTIARERGIAAYRAWLPLENIRPPTIPREKWEEMFAWPANNEPPYPPLPRRILSVATSYFIVIVVVVVLLQIFTPFPILNWLGRLTGIGNASP
jgi:hypothetical protein